MRSPKRAIEDQVIVITGASSGIGLATARMAAKRGARVVVSARNAEDLAVLADEITAAGGFALAHAADVSDARAVEALKDAALDRFGRIDTWVNNAGLSLYGKLAEVDLVEARRVFDVNFWGVVHGSRVALEAMRGRGGIIVNVGSVLSDIAIPIQGFYSASKHAVRGFTNALRVEIEMDDLPIDVSLVKPSAIDTPYVEHARNYMETLPINPPPVYAPEVVADAILHCAEHPRRDLVVGGAGKLLTFLDRIAPSLGDTIMARTMAKAQRSDKPKGENDSLFLAPLVEGHERGPHHAMTFERSLYTKMAMNPGITAAVALGVFAALLITASRRG